MITTFGEIMLRISPKVSSERITQAIDFYIFPGGSESNVAIALSNLGVKTCFVSALPDSPLSQIVLQRLMQFNVNTDHVILKGERLGLYWTETGIGPRNSYVIYDRDNSAFSESSFNDFNWTTILKETTWFHFSGISPAVSKSVAGLLERITASCSCSYSVDLNYREKLWKWLAKDKDKINKLMTVLCSRSALIAGNESDFGNIFGFNSKKETEESAYSEIAEKCFDKFSSTKYIAISNRKSLSATQNEWNGYLFIKGSKSIMYKSITYMLDCIQDRVGTGDSFVAGIIYGLNNLEKMSYQETIDFAVTLAALNHTTLGDFSRFSKDEVLNTLKSGGSGRIVR